MDTNLLSAVIVWAALGIGLACVLVRLKVPLIQPPEAPQPEEAAEQIPATLD